MQPSTALAPPLSPEPAPRGTTGTPCAEAAASDRLDLGGGLRAGQQRRRPGLEESRRRLVAAVGGEDLRVGDDLAGAGEVIAERRE